LDENVESLKPGEEPIARSDREAVKSSIFSLLATSPTRAIGLQLATVLRVVVQRDFPERWPGLLDEVKRMLTSGDARQVGAGCMAALECVKAFT
jgi:importin-7